MRPGTRVAVFLANRLEHVELAFALNLLGATYVPVNPDYRGPVLLNALTTAQPVLTIVDPGCAPWLAPYADHAGRVARLGEPGSDYPQEMIGMAPHEGDPEPTDEAMVLFTSGTTGPSKGVALSSRFCLEVATANGRARQLAPGERVHSSFAFCHANPFVNTLLPALIHDGSMAWSSRFSVAEHWVRLRDLGAQHFTLFTALLRMLLAAPPSELDRAHGATTCFSVGTPPVAGAEFEQRFGVTIVEGYGLTECGAITYQWAGARRLGSAGRPTPGWQVAVHDDEGMAVPAGTVGEIVGRPERPGLLMNGYVGRAEATLETFRGLWFHTGDRGYLDEDGYLWFVDRQKDAIRRRGENISSYEVEEAIRQTGLCVDGVAYPVPSQLGEDEVMVAVVPLDPQFSESTLHAALEGLLPRYAVPTFVRVVDELPRTPTGKTEKYKLRADGVTPTTWTAPRRPAARPAAP